MSATQYQNMNQFGQTPLKGRVSNVPTPSTISCQITGASSNTFYPGTAVVLISGTSQTILIEKATATQPIFGFVVWNPKQVKWTAGMNVEVAMPGTVMEMESQAAFNRGQLLQQVATNDQVQAYTGGTNTTIGIALDTASGANKIVRVLIRTVAEYSSSSSSSSSKSSSSSSSSSAT